MIKRSPAMQDIVDNFSMTVFGRKQSGGACTSCGTTVTAATFRDALSRKEFGISGFCQSCQDEVFGK